MFFFVVSSYLQLILDDASVQKPLKSIEELKPPCDGGAVIKGKRDERGQAAVQLLHLLLELSVISLQERIEGGGEKEGIHERVLATCGGEKRFEALL